MSILNNSLLLKKAAASGDGGSTPADPVTRSLRFDPSSNSYLQRATGSTDTTWTMAMWVKRSGLTGYQYLFNFGSSWGLAFYTGTNSLYYYNGSTNTSTEVFRDPSAWFHLTMVTTSGTATFYVNGVQVTSNSFSTPRTSSALGTVTFGRWSSGAYDFDGYLADIHFIEGEAKSPTDFIESNGYGGYKPKEYTGSFGTNGFHIDAQPLGSDADLLVSSIDRNGGDTTFADAAQGHGLTVSGDTKHSVAVGNPFTGEDRAVTLPDTNGNLEIADHNDFDLGDTDWTVEGWFNLQNSGGQSLISKSGEWQIYYYSGEIRFYLNNSFQFRCYWTATLGKWHHIALCHDSSANDLQFYVDGEPISSNESSSTSSYSWPTGSGDLFINKWSDTYATQYTKEVHVYDVRVINGTKVYSGSFTPPSGKLTTTGGTYPSTTNVNTSITSSHTVLLIQPENSDTDFHDESDSSHTITGNGSPTRTASTPYEAAAKSTAMYFDGSGDYLQTPSDSIFAIGTSETFTAECWVYFKSNPSGGSYMGILSTYNVSSALNWIIENAGGYWSVYDSSGTRQATSTAVTTGVWHHVALVKNSSTAGDSSLYLNGTRLQTCTVSSNATAARKLTVGGIYASTNYNLNGYIFDARYAKGETKYTGSTYTVPSAPFELNPVYLGADQSGNKNHFTPTNISSHDTVLDTPTRNYATMSPVNLAQYSGTITFGEGNLSISSSGTANNKIASTQSMPSGKWYAEVRPNAQNNAMVGVCRPQDIVVSSQSAGYGGAGHVVYVYNGKVYNGSTSWTSQAYTSTADGDDVIQLAVDVDNSKIWFGLNDTWEGTVGSSGGHSLDSGEQVFVYSYRDEVIWNFGQDPTFAGGKTSGQDTSQSEFFYAPPEGFKSLNSSNLDDPTVTPSEHFDVLTYNGNSDLYNASGSTQNVTGVNFDVGMAWIKDRDNNSSGYTSSGSDEYGHYLFDTVTGTSSGGYNLDGDVVSSGSGAYLNSGYYGVTSFSAGSGTSRGITVDEAGETNFDYDDGSYQLTERYVAWLWKLGSTGSSSTWNSSYTAPNTEHYNALAGVTTIDVTPASSGNLEVAHSLSAAPEFFFVGTDGYSNFSGFPAFHKDLTSGNYLQLDGNSAQSSDSTYFPSGAAHADYIKLGSAFIDDYGYGFNLRIWAFTGVDGHSKFGKYTGNGNTSGAGPVVYLGFKPALLMIKRIDSSNNWVILDNKRNPSNTVNLTLQADSSSSEGGSSDTYLDFISTGFKVRNTATANWLNASSGSYIYAAFAESPFKHANAR